MTSIDEESLSKIEEINSLVKRLANSNDPEALKEADNYLNQSSNPKTFDRTVINKVGNINDQEAFMKSVEIDAKERYERKLKQRSESEIIKNTANEYFKVNDYENAIKYYGKAIDICKDYDILYTNRAQAYLKLDKVEEALQDCETAIFLSQKNHKAYLHKGKSLVRLQRFDEAIEDYHKVLELKPNLTEYMQEFIDEANHLKRNFQTRRNSHEKFSSISSDSNLDEILKSLSENGSDVVEYYIGGLTVLGELISSNKKIAQILKLEFIHNSKIFDSDSSITKMIRVICSKPKLDDNDAILLCNWLNLIDNLFYDEINQDDDSFLIDAFNSEHLSVVLDYCLKHQSHLPITLCTQVQRSLYYLTNSSVNIQKLLDTYPFKSIIDLLLKSLTKDKDSQLLFVAIALFRNLIESERFKVNISKDQKATVTLIDCLYALFTCNTKNDLSSLSSAVRLAQKLTEHSALRLKMIRHPQFLDSCLSMIESRLELQNDVKHSQLTELLLEFLHNLLVLTKNCSSTDRIQNVSIKLIELCTRLLNDCPPQQNIRHLLLMVLAQLLPKFNQQHLLDWCEPFPQDNSITGEVVPVDTGSIEHQPSLQHTKSPVKRQSSRTDVQFLERVSLPIQLALAIIDTTPTAEDQQQQPITTHTLHPSIKPAVKILSLATQVSPYTRILCGDDRQRVLALYNILGYSTINNNEYVDEVLLGNVCLLLSNCVGDTALADHMSHFTSAYNNSPIHTNSGDVDLAGGYSNANDDDDDALINKARNHYSAIRRLLSVCADSNNNDCRRNAAVLIGKLASCHNVHRSEMDRLNGFSIISKFAR